MKRVLSLLLLLLVATSAVEATTWQEWWNSRLQPRPNEEVSMTTKISALMGLGAMFTYWAWAHRRCESRKKKIAPALLATLTRNTQESRLPGHSDRASRAWDSARNDYRNDIYVSAAVGLGVGIVTKLTLVSAQKIYEAIRS